VVGSFFDYVQGDSALHRLNPITKIILSLILCAACFATESIFFCIAIIAINILIALSAGVAGRAVSILKLLLKFCSVLFILQVLFVREGNILMQLPILNIVITDKGILFSSMMVLRLIGSTLPLALMLSVTKMNDLSNALVSRVGIPYGYVFAMITAMRFIPVFSSEMEGIIEAQTARGVEFDTKNVVKKIMLIFPLCVPLLITSVRKIEETSIAAELRGFNCRKRESGYKKYPFRAADSTAVFLGIFLAVAGRFFPF